MSRFQLYIVTGFALILASCRATRRWDEWNGMAAENGASQTKTTGRQSGAIR